MRPVLRPGLRLVGDLPAWAVVLDAEDLIALDGTEARLLQRLDGLTTDERALATPDGDDPGASGYASGWARLHESGLVIDTDALLNLTSDLTTAQRSPVHGDVLALVADDPHTADGRWRRRREALVQVLGYGALALDLAGLLCRSGIGTIAVAGADKAADPGTDAHALRELRERHPGTRVLSRLDAVPDLAVVAADREPAPEQVGELMRNHVPHLVAGLRGRQAVVGPFVLPGETACLHCVDLIRGEREPAWPLVRERLAHAAPTAQPFGTPQAATVTTLAAALAGTEALNFVDGRGLATADTSYVMSLADPVPRPRSWSPRPECGCGWPQEFP